MRRKLFFSLALTLTLHLSSAQDYFIKFYSDSSNASVTNLQLNEDSNLVLFGATIEPITWDLLYGQNVICFDTNGNQVFVAKYHETETSGLLGNGQCSANALFITGCNHLLQGCILPVLGQH